MARHTCAHVCTHTATLPHGMKGEADSSWGRLHPAGETRGFWVVWSETHTFRRPRVTLSPMSPPTLAHREKIPMTIKIWLFIPNWFFKKRKPYSVLLYQNIISLIFIMTRWENIFCQNSITCRFCPKFELFYFLLPVCKSKNFKQTRK